MLTTHPDKLDYGWIDQLDARTGMAGFFMDLES
jgi:hypothetical protein